MIIPTSEKFFVDENVKNNIMESSMRAISFIKSMEYVSLKEEFDAKVKKNLIIYFLPH